MSIYSRSNSSTGSTLQLVFDEIHRLVSRTNVKLKNAKPIGQEYRYAISGRSDSSPSWCFDLNLEIDHGVKVVVDLKVPYLCILRNSGIDFMS